MRSLANRLCIKPGETSLRPEITGLLEQLEGSVRGTGVTATATRAVVGKAVAVEEVVNNSEEREKMMEAEVTAETPNEVPDSLNGMSKKQVSSMYRWGLYMYVVCMCGLECRRLSGSRY